MPEIDTADETMRARLGARVRELRKARGWTERQLGDVAGVTRSYINLIENGRITLPKRVTLLRLAEALKTTPEDLLRAAGYLPESVLLSPSELVLARSLAGLSDKDRAWLLETVNRLKEAS